MTNHFEWVWVVALKPTYRAVSSLAPYTNLQSSSISISIKILSLREEGAHSIILGLQMVIGRGEEVERAHLSYFLSKLQYMRILSNFIQFPLFRYGTEGIPEVAGWWLHTQLGSPAQHLDHHLDQHVDQHQHLDDHQHHHEHQHQHQHQHQHHQHWLPELSTFYCL